MSFNNTRFNVSPAACAARLNNLAARSLLADARGTADEAVAETLVVEAHADLLGVLFGAEARANYLRLLTLTPSATNPGTYA